MPIGWPLHIDGAVRQWGIHYGEGFGSCESHGDAAYAVFLLFFGLPVCFCGLVCVFGFLSGTACWTAYRSTTSTFVAID